MECEDCSRLLASEPRVITSGAELLALPEGTIGRADGCAVEKATPDEWWLAGSNLGRMTDSYLARVGLTVLYVPEVKP